jgi:hypothetical protein
MGMELPNERLVTDGLGLEEAKHYPGLMTFVYHYCAEFMEGDEGEALWLGEAESWYKQFKDAEESYIFETWPDMQMLLEHPCFPRPRTVGTYRRGDGSIGQVLIGQPMKGHPTIVHAKYRSGPDEEWDGDSCFIWVFKADSDQPVYNILHDWPGKPAKDLV